MSVADILAAARKKDGKGGDAPEASSTPAETPSPQPSPARGEGESAPKPAVKPGERPNVKDILALARAGKAAGAAPAAKPAVAKPAAKAAGRKAGCETSGGQGSSSESGAGSGGERKRHGEHFGCGTGRCEARPDHEGAGGQRCRRRSLLRKRRPKKRWRCRRCRPSRLMRSCRRPKGQRNEHDRRSFFGYVFGSSLAVGMSAMAVTGGLWSLGLARFMFPNVLTEPPSRFKVGSKENFAPGQVETSLWPRTVCGW